MPGLSYYIHSIRSKPGFWSNLPSYAVNGVGLLWYKHVRRGGEYEVRFGNKPFKMNFIPLGQGEGSQGLFFYRERYEPLMQFGSALIAEGDTVFDLGSNQGAYACAFSAAVGPKGRMIAVEPVPWQAERVRANLAANGFAWGEVVEAAVSDRDGSTVLDIGVGETSASIVSITTDKTLEVRTLTIDSIAEQGGVDRVDLIKLDVEGAEILALQGGRGVLERYRPILCLEASSPAMYDSICAELGPFGYEGAVFDAKGVLVPVPVPIDYETNVFFLSGTSLEEHLGKPFAGNAAGSTKSHEAGPTSR